MSILDDLSSTEETSFLDDLVPKGMIVPRIDVSKIISEYFKEEDRERDIVPSLHPSELASVECIHYHAHSYKCSKVKQSNPQRLNLIFENGHSVHERWQKIFTPYLKGTWKCKSCGHYHNENIAYQEYLIRHNLTYMGVTGNEDADFSDTPIHCPEVCYRCGNSNFSYREWRVVDLDNLICGRTDGIIQYNEDQYILEIKSANVSSFESLSSNGLLGKYKKQTGIYMYYTGVKYCMILVENKNTQELKTFFYSMDDLLQEPYFANYLRRVQWISHSVANKLPMAEPTKNRDCERCKYKGAVCRPK